MGKITHNGMTKQNARTAIFARRERTSETEERLYKDAVLCIMMHSLNILYVLVPTCVSDESRIAAHSRNNDHIYVRLCVTMVSHIVRSQLIVNEWKKGFYKLLI